MDKKTYEKFYGYGAYACGDKPSEFHEHRYALFQNFLDANPLVVPYDDGDICCETQVVIGGRWRCYIPRYECGRAFEHDIYDHKHAMRLKGVRKSIFIATHPYNYTTNKEHVAFGLDNNGYNDMPSKILKGLTANVYPKDKSWYYTDHSSLCIIGRDDVLEMLDLSVLDEPLEVFVGTREL